MLYKSIINIILPISLCLTSSIEAITIHFIKKVQNINVNSVQLIIISEIIKLLISFIFFYITKNADVKLNVKNIHWFVIPSIIYMISNNLTYFALFYMTPSMFNLLSNLKIPITTLLAFIFLHRLSFNIYQLLTIIFIFSGNILAFYSNEVINISNIGLISMIIYSLCSGTAAVYSEYIMKFRFREENIFLQSIKFCTCSILSNLFLLILISVSSQTVSIFIWNIETVHFLGISSMALNGMMSALVLKYSGSIIKTYSTSLSVFVSIIMSYLLWNYNISLYFILGVIVSFTGINIFLYDKYKKSSDYRIFVDLETNNV